MLPFYAKRLSTTEINYTFHRIPAPKTIDNWKALTPENFSVRIENAAENYPFVKLS